MQEIDKGKDEWIGKLGEAVAIPSVSSDGAYRQHCHKMADWLDNLMQSLGVKTSQVPLGKHVMAGKELELPPIILGEYKEGQADKKTVLIYGHFDVQPALKSDGWKTEPFELTTDSDGRMYGRGSTDDKGPLLGWLAGLQAFQKAGVEFPVHLKIISEGMEETGSEGLDEVVLDLAHGKRKGVGGQKRWLEDVDAICISDSYWLSQRKPCLTYGLRGVSYYDVCVSGPAADLHSGVFGGAVHEPMTDLFKIFAGLVEPNGHINIKGVYDDVAPLDDSEARLYEPIDFDLKKDFDAATGADISIHSSKERTLQARWRYPSLSIHGIQGAFSEPGAKTVIPACVHGKFSIRTVNDMNNPEKLNQLVNDHIVAAHKALGTKTKIKVEALHAGKPWMTDPSHWNYQAAKRATEKVYGVTPDFTREGGSIPLTLVLDEALKKNVLLLPMGRSDDGAHSVNEKLDVTNFVQGSKQLATYLWEVGQSKE